jgi:putative ABC transport system ATP-binding protein
MTTGEQSIKKTNNQARNDLDSAPVLIEVKDLLKIFKIDSGPVTVLRDINFKIKQGSFTIIFGPSGSGKSTLMNVLSGLEPPTEGCVKVSGQDIYQLNADLRSNFRGSVMGIVHQVNYWVKSLNVLENVAMPLYLSGSDKAAALRIAIESLKQVGMEEYANYRPNVLSGGQQQRVSMARALVAYPQLIMTDEPTGNLDSKNGKFIIDLLVKFNRELKRTIILVTHNIEYLPLSDNQLYIFDGQVTTGKPGESMPPEILESLRLQLDQLTKMERES